jgi:hypothetical protein
LLELLGNFDEYTAATVNATKNSTEDKYIAETVEAVEKGGRFSHANRKYYFCVTNIIQKINTNLFQHMVPPFQMNTPINIFYHLYLQRLNLFDSTQNGKDS